MPTEAQSSCATRPQKQGRAPAPPDTLGDPTPGAPRPAQSTPLPGTTNGATRGPKRPDQTVEVPAGQTLGSQPQPGQQPPPDTLRPDPGIRSEHRMTVMNHAPPRHPGTPSTTSVPSLRNEAPRDQENRRSSSVERGVFSDSKIGLKNDQKSGLNPGLNQRQNPARTKRPEPASNPAADDRFFPTSDPAR